MDDVLSQAHQWLQWAYQESPYLVNAVMGVLLYVATWHGAPAISRLAWRAAKRPFASPPPAPPEPEPPPSELCQALLADLSRPLAFDGTFKATTATGALLEFSTYAGERSTLTAVKIGDRLVLGELPQREQVLVTRTALDAAKAHDEVGRVKLARQMMAKLWDEAPGEQAPLTARRPHPLRGGLNTRPLTSIEADALKALEERSAYPNRMP